MATTPAQALASRTAAAIAAIPIHEQLARRIVYNRHLDGAETPRRRRNRRDRLEEAGIALELNGRVLTLAEYEEHRHRNTLIMRRDRSCLGQLICRAAEEAQDNKFLDASTSWSDADMDDLFGKIGTLP